MSIPWSRQVRSRYVDPLDQIWLAALAKLGLRLRRDRSAYASTDGRGTLTVAPPEDLDADDCLAQIVLHELCHALVQGEHSFAAPDWGLHDDEAASGHDGDTVREQACLRTQAALLRRHGLRQLLAPTTDFRSFYDRLPEDPLAAAPDDAAVPLARAALGRAARAPYEAVLGEALEKTAAVHRLLGAAAEPPAELPSLWHTAPPPRRHANGWPLLEQGPSGDRSCRDCAWRFDGGTGSRCRRARGGAAAVVDPDGPACVLHEGPLDCRACAACCRDAYDLVPLRRDDAIGGRHPELVLREGRRRFLRRDPVRRWCAALSLDQGAHRCTVYEDRPRACRDFPAGGTSCLTARRRVGLSV